MGVYSASYCLGRSTRKSADSSVEMPPVLLASAAAKCLSLVEKCLEGVGAWPKVRGMV